MRYPVNVGRSCVTIRAELICVTWARVQPSSADDILTILDKVSTVPSDCCC